MRVFAIKFIKSLFGCLCTLITIIQFFLATDTYKDFAKKFSLPTKISKEGWLIISIIIAVIILSVELHSYFKESKKAKLSGANFHQFNHLVRNFTFLIEDPAWPQKYNTHELFYEKIAVMCERLCDEIYNFIKQKTEKDFSVCIKLLQSGPKFCEESDIMAYTLCRSGQDRNQRQKNGLRLQQGAISEHEISTLVKENTAFQHILNNEQEEGRKSIFACSNLLMLKILNKILGREEYKNPNKEFWKHYLSTIVIPIRINARIIKYDFNNTPSTGCVTVGFLCIDHKRPISKALKNELVEYCNGFADTFFNLLYETHKCDKIIVAREQVPAH